MLSNKTTGKPLGLPCLLRFRPVLGCDHTGIMTIEQIYHSFSVSGLLNGSDIFIYPSIKYKTEAFDVYKNTHLFKHDDHYNDHLTRQVYVTMNSTAQSDGKRKRSEWAQSVD